MHKAIKSFKFMENIKQSLIEAIADFLDREDIKFEEALSGLKDPVERENSELHIKMAEAAFSVYIESLVPVFAELQA